MTARPVRRVLVTDATNRVTVCSSSLIANTFQLRLVGLLGKRSIAPDEGLLIKPSSGVHTFGMRFPIDIVALDKRNRVLGAWSNIGPWRIRGLGLRTRSVLELAAGRIHQCGIARGDQLCFAPLPAGKLAFTSSD